MKILLLHDKYEVVLKTFCKTRFFEIGWWSFEHSLVQEQEPYVFRIGQRSYLLGGNLPHKKAMGKCHLLTLPSSKE